MDATTKKAPKVFIQNLQTGEQSEAQFNPTEITRTTAANYARKAVLGQSHQPMQYVGTGNLTFQMDLYYDSAVHEIGLIDPFGGDSGDSAHERSRESRRFLESLLYAPEYEQGSGSLLAEPPDCLVVWPKNFSIICKLVGLSFQDTRFNSEGAPIQFTAQCMFEENSPGRMTQEFIRRVGSLRGRTDS